MFELLDKYFLSSNIADFDRVGCGGTGNIMCSECGGRGHL